MEVWAEARAELLMSTRATFIPRLWQRLAKARPMPEAAPVIRVVCWGAKIGWGGILLVGVGGGEERKWGGGRKRRGGCREVMHKCEDLVSESLKGRAGEEEREV